MIVDFHTHIFPPYIKTKRAEYISRDPCFALLYSNPKARIATTGDLIEAMDRADIDISVIANIGWTTHEMCVETNDYIIDSVSRCPDRLIGFCSIQPESPEAALDEIERCARAGIKGIGELRPDTQFFDFTDDNFTNAFTKIMKKYNLILMLHSSEPVGHRYQGKGTVTPGVLYPMISQLEGINIVCSHWGGGLLFYELMPEVKKTLANVYYDTAASPFLYSPEIYRRAINLVGNKKILFGSDYPLMPPERQLKDIYLEKLEKNDKELILSGNAKRLLRL